MRNKFQRKIIKNRKEKQQFSLNLPLEGIKKIRLENSGVELVFNDNTITIKKIEQVQNKKTRKTNKDKRDLF